MKANPDGLVNNYDDLKVFTEIMDTKAAFGYGTVDEWITGWGSTKETQANFNMRVGCVGNEAMWNGDLDRRGGKGGKRGGMMKDGDRMIMNMDGTKVMVKMGAITVAAPVATIIGAMTLW